jgi:HD-like signal output (HDOD) protein/GGDEF domain-containing protein
MYDPATTLDRLATRAGQLYSLPTVAMKVLELTENPEVDTRALKECIENDPALTAKILRVVNRSLFGLSREVSDLNQALALLGTKPLKLLVLGFSLPSGMFAGVEGKTLAWYWRHTLTKAVAGREISETLWKAPGDDAFIAGLLQDIGTLTLLQQLGEPYAKFLDRIVGSHAELGALETQAMGFSHTALSARLLANWRLPQSLVEAVAWSGGNDVAPTDASGTPAPHAASSLAQVLHLAELVARLLADAQPRVLGQLLAAGQSYHGLSEAQLETLVGHLEETVRQLAAVLSLQLPDGLEYRDVLADAHRQLARLASQAAEDLLRNGLNRNERVEEESLLEDIQDLTEAVSSVCRRAAEPSGVKGPVATAAVAAAAEPSATWRPAVNTRATATDPGLSSRLAVAVAACRQSRRPLSLLLAELAHPDEVMVALGMEGFETVRRLLGNVCHRVDHPCALSTAHGEAGFAVVLPDCERHKAVALGDQLIRTVNNVAAARAKPAAPALALAVGVATVARLPKNFPPQDLLAGAERCLYGSHASGGGVVKSIEIY